MPCLCPCSYAPCNLLAQVLESLPFQLCLEAAGLQYVQGVDLGNMVFTSGQILVNPETCGVSSNIAEQALQSLNNVKAVVQASGLTVSDIVKVTVFVKELNDFATVNEVYGRFFDDHEVAHHPARSCTEASRLSKDAGIEIEAIAVRK